jgi:hypothetical protein
MVLFEKFVCSNIEGAYLTKLKTAKILKIG